MKSMINKIAVLLVMVMVAGCGENDAFSQLGGTGGGGTTGPKAASVSLAATKTSVKSDSSDSATITATVLDASNAAMANMTVAFSASGGQLSAASAITDALGKATVLFSSGTSDPSNRTATVIAAASGVAAVQIPIVVIGSTLAISSDKPALIIGGAAGEDQATLTVTAKNAGGAAVYNAAITFSVAGSGTSPGAATLTSTSGTTNVSGQATTTVTGTSAGTVTVTATGLGYTITKDFEITQAGAAFVISSPSNPATLSTQVGQSLMVTVSAPTQANVTFASSLGIWDGTSSLVTKPVAAGTVSAVLTSTAGGTATVQVYDPLNPATFATLTVLISAPSSQAAQIDLQSNVSVLAPSLGGTLSQATFTATVRTIGGTLVSGAPVAFTLTNTTGGGETISPVYGITDTTGRVTSTFTSGSLSSNATGVIVTATLYDSASAVIASISKNIKINQTAGSVVIGAGTTLSEPVAGGASYALPMSVVVADSNGNPVQTTVTLSVWPSHYNTGYWSGVGTCAPVVTAVWDNEDTNRNLILDAGEDLPYVKGPYPASSQGFTVTDTGTVDGNLRKIYTVESSLSVDGGVGLQNFVTDATLTPGNSAGGTLPATVTTDANGLANFTLTYAKQYAVWIKDEIRAATTVLGTETTSILSLPLPFILSDGSGCHLFNSPFNPRPPAP